jgi:lipopolysaccharide heptosyltransferase II
MKINFSTVKKLLVIKLRAIGDVVLSTVVLENLRSAFPSAQIDFLTETSSREVVEGNPNVDNVIVYQAKHDNSIGLIKDIRNRRYDIVFDLFGNPRTAIITLLSGARYRVGYRFTWRQYCYNMVVEPRGGEVHNTEFNLDALGATEVQIVKREIQFPVDAGSERFAEEFLARAGSGLTVALNPGGGWYTKRWRIPQYAEVGDAIVKEFGATVLLVWGPGEEEHVRELQSKMSHPSILLPPTSLKQLGSILKRCHLMVTNDSGPMHIAAALGTPVVAIYGPTNPKLQGPVGEGHVIVRNERLTCLNCNLTDCPIGNPCMLELSVGEVLDGVRRALARNKIIPERYAAI